MLLTINPIPGEYYNIGGTFSCSIGEMLNTLLSMSPEGKNIEVKVDVERLRPIDADLQVPNTEKFFQHTGWKPEIPFEQTMQELLDYWRDKVSEDTNFLTR